MELQDTDLIARVLARDDRHAFAELVRRHQSALRGFLRRVTGGDSALADDLAQETFIEAYKGLARFSGTSSFETWIAAIGYNRFRQYLRKRREQPVAEVEDAASDDDSGTVRPGLATDMDEAMSHLRSEERAALELCYARGLSHQEAAQVMGCPTGTVKTHILRAKEQLRQLLSAYAGA